MAGGVADWAAFVLLPANKGDVVFEAIFPILNTIVLGNSVLAWAYAIFAAFFAFFVLVAVRQTALGYVRRLAVTIHATRLLPLVDALEKTKTAVLLVVAVWLGTQGLALPPKIETLLGFAALAAVMIQAGLWVNTLLNAWLERYRSVNAAEDKASVTSLNVVGFIGKVVVWTVILLMLLDNFGIDITAFVAGLGIGGVAVALALQSVLGDLFASLTILVDKPFVVGDFLILDDYMGTVENVGLKTTRIRSLSGEQIILSNSNLLGSKIRNYGKMVERRVPIKIGVRYQTSHDHLKLIPQIIREAILQEDKVRFDRAHLQGYGAYSIDFEYVYYVLSADYNTFMDINERINLALHKRFGEEGIEFAYPTQTVMIGNAVRMEAAPLEKAARKPAP